MKAVVLAFSSLLSNLLPIPPEYQKETSVWVQTMSRAELDEKCGTAPPGYVILACGKVGQPYIYMPNPCGYPEASDTRSYAHLMCHEIAHTEGWRHN
jgi:hypothetical protein